MSMPARPFLVLGIGNVLLGDDGIGVHLLGELQRRADGGDVSLPADTRLVDGGTVGLGLLPIMAGARALLLLDAVDLGLEPGAVTVLRGRQLEVRVGAPTDVGPAGVCDLLAAARLADVLPRAIALVGVQPGEIAGGLALAEVVQAAMPAALAAVIDELARLDADAEAGSVSRETMGDVRRSAA